MNNPKILIPEDDATFLVRNQTNYWNLTNGCHMKGWSNVFSHNEESGK